MSLLTSGMLAPLRYPQAQQLRRFEALRAEGYQIEITEFAPLHSPFGRSAVGYVHLNGVQVGKLERDEIDGVEFCEALLELAERHRAAAHVKEVLP